MGSPLAGIAGKLRLGAKARLRRLGSELNALTGVGAQRAAIRDLEAAGVAAVDAAKVADTAKEVEKRAALLDEVEKEFKRVSALPAKTVVTAVKAAGDAPSGGALSRIWANMSAKDRAFLLDEAIRLVRSGKAVHNNMTGVVREVAVKYLPEMRLEVIATVAHMRRNIRGGRRLSTMDTAARGPVHLPTKKVMADGRGIELGTDRLIGTTRGTPQKVTVKWSDGTVEDVTVAGELDVALAVEVKGKTNAQGGVRQLKDLAARGDAGYVMIDGQFWLLKYEPSKVRHVVVAPPGEEFTAAKRALGATKSLSGSKAIEIPKEFDGRIHGMADYLLEAARRYTATP